MMVKFQGGPKNGTTERVLDGIQTIWLEEYPGKYSLTNRAFYPKGSILTVIFEWTDDPGNVFTSGA